jgi:hypothetical protein
VNYTRIIAAVFSIVVFVQQASADHSLTLTRNSRPVTSAEASGGAPSDGIVHDFYVTSDADLLVLAPEIGVSVYKHQYGSNREPPDPELVAMYPAVGASSYLKLPGDTIVLGGGFTVPGSAWGDLSDDGPQSNYHLGRLTTSQAGTFSGTISVRGAGTPIWLPFSLSLPGPGDGLMASQSEELSVSAAAPTYPVPPGPVTPPLDPPHQSAAGGSETHGCPVRLLGVLSSRHAGFRRIDAADAPCRQPEDCRGRSGGIRP